MRMSTAVVFTAALIVSKELLADAVTRPRTSAVMVAMRPAPSLTVSLDSLLRCCSGKVIRSHIPISTPPSVHANTMVPTRVGFMVRLQTLPNYLY